MRTKKYIGYIGLFLLTCIIAMPAYAEWHIRHEVGLSGGGGISALNYSLNENLFDHNVQVQRGWGAEGALGYTFFFHKNWGIGTNFGIAQYNSTSILSGNTLIATDVKYMNKDCNLHSTLNYYEEQQRLRTFNVSIYGQFQTADVHSFYARFGGKLAFTQNATYSIKNSSAKNTLEIPELENSISDDNVDVNSSGKLPLNVGLMLMAEAGTKWNINDNFSLYTGIYIDYGIIVDMYDQPKTSFIAPDYTGFENKYTFNSVLSSRNGTTGANIANAVSPMAVGIVLRLAVGTAYARLSTANEPPAKATPVEKTQTQTQTQPQASRNRKTSGSTAGSTTNAKSTDGQYVILPATNAPQTVALPPTTPYYYSPQRTPTPASNEYQPRQGRRITLDTQTKVGEISHIQIFDASGVLVHEQMVRGVVTTVEVPYKKGTYLIQVGRQVKKVIVE
jgi:hypothetical protein